MIRQLCSICKKNNFKVLYPENFDIKKINSRTFSARRLPDRVHYRIVKCRNCGLIYSNPILEYDKIEKLYRKSFTSYDEHLKNLKATYSYYLKKLILNKKSSPVPFLSSFWKERRQAGRSEHAQLSEKNGSKNFFKKAKLLEIGCGNGFFLEEAAAYGFDVYGIEPGKPSVNKAKPAIKKKVIVDIFKPGQFKKNFFDVICCFQTFDHVPDPNLLLKECHKILKKGGFMLFFNHDAGAWQNRLMGEKSPIIDIEHTYLYDKKTMRRIFEKHRFKVLKVISSFNIHNLSYWLHLFPLPNSVKISLIKVLDRTGLGKMKIKLNPGNLVLFARK